MFTSTDESPGPTFPGNTGQDVGFTITQVWRRTADQGMIPAVANYLVALSSQDKGGMPHNATPRGHTRGSRTWKHRQKSLLWEETGHGNRLSRFSMGWCESFQQILGHKGCPYVCVPGPAVICVGRVDSGQQWVTDVVGRGLRVAWFALERGASQRVACYL